MALDNFTDLDMANDFRLLEELTRNVDSFRRDKLKRSTRQGTEMMRAPKLPRQLANLQNQAKVRGTRLRYLPPHFSRRVSNTTNYQHKTKAISWMVELVFPHACQNVILDKITERTKLWKVISDYVEFKKADDPKDPFQFYRSMGYGGLSLYLKTEGIPSPGEKPRRFHPLNMKRSLKTNLKGKVLIEYPIIHVAFKTDDVYKDDIDTSDDEDEPTNASNEAGEIVTNEQELNEIGSERRNWSWNDQHGSKEAFKKEDPGVEEASGDVVLSQEEAQMADPQAYKDYFDFYLKYYTQKMARQAGPDNLPMSNHDPLRPSFVGAPPLPSVIPMVPNMSQPPPFGPTLPPFSAPPPRAPYFQPPPQQSRPNHESPQYRPHRGGYSNQATGNSGHQNKTNTQHGDSNKGGYPNRSHVPQGGYPSRSHVPPKKNFDDAKTNLSNLDSAKKIREELREKPVGLSSLMAYGSGSSDSE